ncbi:TIR domain-containing protein [Winogradskyella sp.]|jgi:hypothetical protein|uniref:TIR domain-containing protein n=1 Tax=Winogradskyella sp. TaxID=1883156 RepID=UPI0025E5CF72|nr:TIR domain-containing protein [Winogradskyella sp.]MCT4628816.1 TIR domain-containing protein [Winogradskyella sp.]
MARKCFISFKMEDKKYKEYIQNNLNIDMIDKSLNVSIDSDDIDYILSVIRRDYLSKSTVTIHLIGAHSSENQGTYEQRFIKRELQASLYNGKGNTRNGILGIVLPEANNAIFQGSYHCLKCGNSHNVVKIDNSTTISEFSYNYYIPNDKCHHDEDDRYCVLVSWHEFIKNPEAYIEQTFQKRETPIADKTRVRP